MPRFTKTQEATTKAFLASLEQAESEPVGKSTADFARMAVGPQYGGTQAHSPINRNKVVEAYRGSTYVAIGAVARKVAQQEIKAARATNARSGVKYEPLEFDHPLNLLLEESNPFFTQFEMWFYTVGWLLLTGDHYNYKAFNGFNLPAELWPIPSPWVTPIPSETSFIGGYRVEGVFSAPTVLDRQEVVHFRQPSLDWSGNKRFFGQSAVMAGSEMVDAETWMHHRKLWALKNFAPPGLHYETDHELDENQLLDIYSQIIRQHKAAEHTGRPIVSHSGFKVKNPTGNGQVVDYRQDLELAMDWNLALHGVPKAVVGLVHDANRANMEAALLTFAENTINPLLVMMGQQLTRGLAHDFGDDLVAFFNPVTVKDADKVRRDIETAARHGATTPNEIRDLLLDKPSFPNGGDWAVSSGKIMPFGTEETIGQEPPQLPEDSARQQPAARTQGPNEV